MTSRRDQLYRSIGETLHLAQTLELLASTLATIVEDRFDSPAEAEGLLLPAYRSTLGRLIGDLKKILQIDATAENLLANALDSRNYVAHHFFNRNAHAFQDDDSFRAASEALEAHQFALGVGVTLLQAWVDACCKAFGLDKNLLLIKQTPPDDEEHAPRKSLHSLASRRLSSNERHKGRP